MKLKVLTAREKPKLKNKRRESRNKKLVNIFNFYIERLKENNFLYQTYPF